MGMLNRAQPSVVLCLSGLALAGGLGGCASQQRAQPPQQAQLTRAISAPERLGPPQYLPESSRAILRGHMPSHARDMGDLMSAIMLLHYDEIHERAEVIA